MGFRSFLGVAEPGVDDATVQRGRRRVVNTFTFIAWTMLTAALVDPYWVSGGEEYDLSNRRRLELAAAAAAAGGGAAASEDPFAAFRSAPPAREHMLGDTVQRYFSVGLTNFQIDEGYQWYRNQTTVIVPRTTVYSLGTFVNTFVAYLSVAGCGQDWGRRWCGMSLTTKAASATQGLGAFAVVLLILGWLALSGIQYEFPYVSGKVGVWAVRGLIGLGAFFSMVTIAVFGVSPYKTDFCALFDPDANYNGLGCDFGNGFVVAAVAFAFATVAAIGASPLWMSDDVGAKYAFAASVEPKAAAFTGGSSGGFNASAFGSDDAPKAGSYQS